MRFYWFLLGTLCVWRLTWLLQAEDGPFRLMARLRAAAHRLGGLMECFYCLSFWLAAPFAWLLGADLAERLLLWPALSAGAILLLRATEPRFESPPALYYEESDDVLRPNDLPPEAPQRPGA